MQIDISVIIPFYKGKRYIKRIISYLRENISVLKENGLWAWEVLIINDYPDEKLELSDEVTTELNIKIVNLLHNQGIHGARVCGLNLANGKYVVMLDQDDVIEPDFMYTQLLRIGDNDAIVCNGFKTRICDGGKRYIYKNKQEQALVVDYKNYLGEDNRIISPGQVVLKKDAVPTVWKENILKNNGADDYFLWLLMLKEGKKFVINEDYLYTHIGGNENISASRAVMNKSLSEMIDILYNKNLLENDDINVIKNSIKLFDSVRVKMSEIVQLFDKWMYLERRGYRIIDYIQARYKKIAVYGMGYLGNRLVDVLETTDIKVCFIIDREAETMVYNYPVIAPEEVFEYQITNQADAIIVTATSFFEQIKERLLHVNNVEIVSLKDIINSMVDEILEETEINE